jgi:hypothetical protein
VSAPHGLLLGLNSAAAGSLIGIRDGGDNVAFLLVALAALVARVHGSWVPAGSLRMGRAPVGSQPGRWSGLAFET